jgi:hypothetical protein
MNRMRIVIAIRGVPGELKHLSNPRKINQVRDSVSSGERKRISLNSDANRRVAGFPIWDVDHGNRTVWNGRPKNVKAVYMKL